MGRVTMVNRRRKFVEAIIGGAPTITEAAKMAGYSPRSAHDTGSTLLKTPEIRDAILAHEREVNSRIAQRAVWDKEQTLAIMADRSQEAAARGAYGPSVRALELYGRELGMFASKIDIRLLALLAQQEGLDPEELRLETERIQRSAAREERKQAQG